MSTVKRNSTRVTHDFLDNFKLSTETKWRTQAVNPTLYGFQFQPGTCWNPGLSEATVLEYQELLGLRFPYDLVAFFRKMNGTDLPTINVYGSSRPAAHSVGVFSYPRDIDIVRQRMEDIHRHRRAIATNLSDQGLDLPPGVGFAPIFSHRYVVCAPNPETSVILSVVTDGTDAIVYAGSLREYLEKEFLG